MSGRKGIAGRPAGATQRGGSDEVAAGAPTGRPAFSQPLPLKACLSREVSKTLDPCRKPLSVSQRGPCCVSHLDFFPHFLFFGLWHWGKAGCYGAGETRCD